MAGTLYRFRNFTLNPDARELYLDDALVPLPVSVLDCLIYLIRNRHRTVGRDELTAAVWGRVDISDVSLSHAIMRLRRLLGDAGNEQNSIRTLPRLGYRWIVEPTIEESTAPVVVAEAATSPAPLEQDISRTPVPRSRRKWLVALAALVVAALVLVAVMHPWRTSPKVDVATLRSVMVLPAEVKASDEWNWLRLGFMDLIANRLRSGNLAVTPSETVVGLVNAHQLDKEFDQASAAASNGNLGDPILQITPHASLVNGLWNVRLEARGKNRKLVVDAQAKDVVSAGRAAADDLLVRLGRTPPRSDDSNPSVALEEFEHRVSAAVLSGQLQVAAQLIHDAPDAVNDSPQIALSQMNIEFFTGEYEASRKRAETLLDELPKNADPRLRARVLIRLGVACFRLDKNDEAKKAFTEAIQLLDGQNDPDMLANAYSGLGVVAGVEQHLEDAASYFGRARTLHEISNDTFGIARVDLNLGSVTMDRGLPRAAVPIFEDAAARFQNLATPEALNSALRSLADAQISLLEHKDALATTDRFWPIEEHSRNPREGWWLRLSRAVVLVSNGRLHEADELVNLIRTSTDPVKDDLVRRENDALAADMALLRGDNAAAADLAARAMTPDLERTNWQDYAGAWVTRIRALQRDRKLDEAAKQVAAFTAWKDPGTNGRHPLYVTLVQSDQAAADGKSADALAGYAQAMASAERLGVPEDIVVVGEAYVAALIANGQVDQASAIAGRMAQWADKDMRVAWAQAAIYNALHQPDASRLALEGARELAGDRPLPPLIAPAVAH